MIEPRRSFHMLVPRDSEEQRSLYSLLRDTATEENDDENNGTNPAEETTIVIHRVLEHDEPEIPVHPALEYEVIEASRTMTTEIRPDPTTPTTPTPADHPNNDNDLNNETFPQHTDSTNHNSNARNQTSHPETGSAAESNPIPESTAAAMEADDNDDGVEEETPPLPTTHPPVVILFCNAKVFFSFVGLIFFGCLNAITLKLQAIPMFNYPNFLNLFCNIMYIPICFACMIPSRMCGPKHRHPEGDNNRDEDDDDDENRATPGSAGEENSNNLTPECSNSSPVLLTASFAPGSAEPETPQEQQQQEPLLEPPTTPTEQRHPAQTSPPPHDWRFHDLMIMGALDSLATTMQIYAAAYLPGPLLILLPQAAIPLSLLVSMKRRSWQRQRQEGPTSTGASASTMSFHWTHYLGATIVVLGILILMAPHWTNQLSPAYYCEAIDVDNDCTICQLEWDERACLSHTMDTDLDKGSSTTTTTTSDWVASPTHTNQLASVKRILQQQEQPSSSDEDPNVTPAEGTLCQWVPFEEATREEEVLASIWSTVLIASCIPMIISTVYKEWAMMMDRSTTNSPPHQRRRTRRRRDYDDDVSSIYLNGWIAVFQLFFSIPLSFLGGLVSSPRLVGPRAVLENLWYGLQCYLLGSAAITGGCHPDSLCGSYSFWLVNLHLLASLGYSYCMLFCLKYGTTSLFFLAVTLMVPLGTAAFLLPFMPLAGTPCITDFAGSITIVLGLILYRFFDSQKTQDFNNNNNNNTTTVIVRTTTIYDGDDNSSNHDPFTFIYRASFPWQQNNNANSWRNEESAENNTASTTPLLFSGDV